MKPYKPEGYNDLSAYLIVDGAQQMIDLLVELFEGKELRKFHRKDKIMHAEVQIGDSVIMLADSTAQYPQNSTILHVYVPNPDAVYKKALELGCEGYKEPTQLNEDDDKRGTFKDFAGNMWSIASQV
ncbi:MAG: extradiol dioxygenase [Cytophagaceae bacterium]|nr:extradiol dioxygenase [Cytophagaceae bacterium]|tara:strand:+ start:5429 stop:5809 length:381 start_codon:yes stop_codon:yes gene_type:complete